MLNFRNMKNVVILGGGTAGWFAALTLRRILGASTEVTVIESPNVGIVGVGEGGVLNIHDALIRNGINIEEFKKATNSTHKVGFSYERWNTGKDDDQYFHPFARYDFPATDWTENYFWPVMSAFTNANRPLHTMFPGYSLVVNNATQEEATRMLANPRNGVMGSMHFDSDKIALFLKQTALSRGIIAKSMHIDDVNLNESGEVTGLIADGTTIPVDFVVDASGLARVIIEKKLNTPWISYSDYLLMDRAIPFNMPHPFKNPYLTSRAIAMNAGWMWQIPLQDRVGAGYVYSSAHMTEEQAIAEVEEYLGHKIEPQKTLHFTPGNFSKIWQKNVLTVGLASGFVEPLEATSIGHMLAVVKRFEHLMVSSHGIIPEHIIDGFNADNNLYWEGIRDFLRFHYDTKRDDTPFWKDVSRSPMPYSYQELRAAWQHRTPRLEDTDSYVPAGWDGMFHPLNWYFVGVGTGVIPPQAATNELQTLNPAQIQRLNNQLTGRNTVNLNKVSLITE